jgi:hypothetical protein
MRAAIDRATRLLASSVSAVLLLASLLSPSSLQASDDKFQEVFGIAPESLRLSAAGYFLDFRFCVQDPVKASLIIRRDSKPFLVERATGTTFISPDAPKVGGLRQTSAELQAGRTYFILFGNPGGYLKPGALVDIHFDGAVMTNVVVDE